MLSRLFSVAKQWSKRLWAWLLYYTGFVRLYSEYWLNGKAVVLTYHRVLDGPDISEAMHPGMYVTREVFERHLEYLSKKYCVVTLNQLREWIQGKLSFPGTPCAITFDDGWDDNYRNAYPLLKRFNLPATIFVITGDIGSREMLTWNQVREMEAWGIAFESHTVSHVVLRGRQREEIQQELRGSKQRLQNELNRSIGWFCYPKGIYDEIADEVVQELYSAAFTGELGLVEKGDDLFHLRRIGIHNDVSMTVPLFACRLTTFL